MISSIPRDALLKALGGDERVMRYVEDRFEQSDETANLVTAGVGATSAISDATVVTLSPNDSFANERILAAGDGIEIVLAEPNVVIKTDRSVARVRGGFTLGITVAGDSNVAIPSAGILATQDNIETLRGKTLETPKLSGLGNYATDAAAATGGVPLNGIYHNAGALRIRLV